MDHLIKNGWRWLNEPRQWSGDTITADPDTDFWKVRDFVAKGKGSTVPFLMTHGFLDTNTNIGAKAIDWRGLYKNPGVALS